MRPNQFPPNMIQMNIPMMPQMPYPQKAEKLDNKEEAGEILY